MTASRNSGQDDEQGLSMPTYNTLDGRLLDLSGLTADERAYLARCYAAFRSGMPWSDFGELAHGSQHPLLRGTSGVVTRAVWDHPLYQATSDLEDRLGIRQGELAPDPGDDLLHDPIGNYQAAAVVTPNRSAHLPD
jgi:hypothetical protein